MARRGKARVPTTAELKRLFSEARAGNYALRNAALLAMSYKLGLRAKEIAALTVHDVLDERGRLREECTLTARMAKGGFPRAVFLTSPSVRGPLKGYLDNRREREGILFNVAAPLFKTQKRGGFSPNTMQQLLHRLHERAGIVGGRSHSGRRWYCTELISKGIDLKSVSVLMGHACVSSTIEYVQDNPQKL